MPNKPRERLTAIDRDLRSVAPTGMEDGTKVTIELINGFELFNTRPYHNYETWSDGYRVTGYGITVQREDLDDAVTEFVRRRRAEIQQRASAIRADTPSGEVKR